jgi:cell division protein FtsI (penicillin-binding protein 3)
MQRRHTLLLVLIGLWSAGLVARLLNLQVSRHDHYVAQAHRQQLRSFEETPRRGAILDARGRDLALSISVRSLYAVPREVANPQSTARALAGLLDLNEEELLLRLSNQSREFVWLARRLDPPVSEGVQRLSIPGLYFLSESKRYYPQREIAAQVLGFVGTDDHGLAGLELLYNEILAGKAIRRTFLRAPFRGAALDPPTLTTKMVPQPGQDLRLNLDVVVQYLVERELHRTLDENRSLAWSSSVVLEPESGAILAIATAPGFDPNQFASYPQRLWNNRPIMDIFAPGPAFSLLNGATTLQGDSRARLPEEVAHQLGSERLFTQLRTLGFGRPTGVDLPGESAGIFPPLREWGPSSRTEIAQGRGIAVTQLQLAAAFATLANGGFLYRPYVIATRGETRPEPVARPFSRETCTRMLTNFDRILLGSSGPAPSPLIYTAVGRGGVGPPPGTMAWYVGFTPVRKPQLLCLVALQGSGTHTQVAPVGLEGKALVHSILRELLRYYRLPPEAGPLEVRSGEAPAGDPVKPHG